jgi:CheY-like chemotaxis protein
LARKILLADDSVTAQNMGRRILTDAGYEVTTVNNGSAALKKLAELKPDIVILDVYMPGYGGLEVCQRIKENKETTRVPVLLSVGKLEPFKPDEARRVRADAYLVKPFEASELLTALTKLEDKIVPPADPIKPGRFAKAIAAVEEAPANSFGDAESGWKERLNIPHPAVKESEADFAPEPLPQATPAALPPDITSEEIAALQAAAAALNAKAEATAEDELAITEANTPTAPVVEAGSPVVEAESPEEVPATFASAAPVGISSDPVPVLQEEVEREVASEAARVEPGKEIEEAKPEPVVAAATIDNDSNATDRTLSSDDEVMAALASLGASSDVAPVSSESGLKSAIAAVDLVIAASNLTGPRWVAEPVPLSLDEAAFVLEQEMEKQYAAFAAADAVCAKLSARATSTGWSEGSAVAVAEMPPATSEPVFAETHDAEPRATVSPTLQSSPTENDRESLAAAAGASVVTAASMTSTEAAEPDAKEPGETQRDSEMAAAWTNWKQIRESILGSQTAVQISPADEFPLATEQPQAAAETSAVEPTTVESAKSEPNTSDAISSIVDNMLAELKPKLMEEIAKKLKSDKR